MFFPLQIPGSPQGGNPRKMGKNYKIPPPPVQPPKMRKKLPKNYKKCSENTFFGNFSVFFPHFRGLDRGGEFCNFFPFFGDFRPGGFRGSVRGKTTRNFRTHGFMNPSAFREMFFSTPRHLRIPFVTKLLPLLTPKSSYILALQLDERSV